VVARRPLLISHRTHMGTMPENTLAGIDEAIADGVDGIEIDVRALADGTVVLMHDATLERTVGDPRPLGALRLGELRGMRVRDPQGRVGLQPVPTLAEALARIGAPVVPVIDLCERGLAAGVAREVAEAGCAGRCRLTGPDAEELLAVRARLPGARATLSVPLEAGAAGLHEALARARARRLDGVNPDHRLLDAALLAAARASGLEVTTWTVNDRSRMARLVSLGVDSITTDLPLITAGISQ